MINKNSDYLKKFLKDMGHFVNLPFLCSGLANTLFCFVFFFSSFNICAAETSTEKNS